MAHVLPRGLVGLMVQLVTVGPGGFPDQRNLFLNRELGG